VMTGGLSTRVATAVLCALVALPVSLAGARPRATTERTRRLTATAYCHDGRTESGAPARAGIIAADPRVLPIGSVVRIETANRSYSGVYTVMDTGAGVKGRKIDIFMPSCAKARKFGRQTVRMRVLRHGWDPKAGVKER
jgi:3D (Asp-Asp-Asp) domain-containing protein